MVRFVSYGTNKMGQLFLPRSGLLYLGRRDLPKHRLRQVSFLCINRGSDQDAGNGSEVIQSVAGINGYSAAEIVTDSTVSSKVKLGNTSSPETNVPKKES